MEIDTFTGPEVSYVVRAAYRGLGFCRSGVLVHCEAPSSTHNP